MPLSHLKPEGLFDSERFGFSQVVTSPPGTLVAISGQVGWDANLKVAGDDVGSQAKQALKNLGIALGAAGATVRDVASLRVYIANYQPNHAAEIAPHLSAFFSGGPPPAQTLLGVQSLATPDLLIEIEALAVVSQ